MTSPHSEPARLAEGGAGAAADGHTSLRHYLDEISRHPLLTAAEEIELAQTIEAGLTAHDRLTGSEEPSSDERRRLNRQIREGMVAKQRFIAANLRLVVANARRYRPPTAMDLLDLIQEGNLGLVRAVEKYDWRRGFKFSTYATWWIRQAINRALAEKGRQIRLPVYLSESLPLVEETHSKLSRQLGRSPHAEEISSATGFTVHRVNAALRVPSTVSLDTPLGDDGVTLTDFIPDATQIDALEQVEQEGLADRLRRAINGLPEREERIIALRYGLFGVDETSYDDIASEYGLTANRVRQIAKRAMCRLRHPTSGLRRADFL